MRRAFFGALLLVASMLPAQALVWKDGAALALTGRIRLIGNEPFTRTVLTVEGKDVILASKQKLRAFQGQRVRATGRLRIQRVHFPNPQYDFDRYHLEVEKLERLK